MHLIRGKLLLIIIIKLLHVHVCTKQNGLYVIKRFLCVHFFFNTQPLITRLMIDYIMPDPALDKQKRDNFLREGREKCDA